VQLDHDRLLEGLRELITATGEADCLLRVETQAARLFPAIRVAIRCDEVRCGPGTLELRARGRLLGHLEITGGDVRKTSPALQAFAEHAALALDNARMLDEHEHRARRDPLTGLRNRREFRETLAAATQTAERGDLASVSLVMIDLDRFKEVNDLGGHGAGDRLLRATAAALTAVCRAGDSAFRIGGDEFALILGDTTRDQGALVAARAGAAIARLEGSAGASWGIASMQEDGTTDHRLMTVADAAMYRHKGVSQKATSLEHDQPRRRLVVASRLATRLMKLDDVKAIAEEVVDELHRAFGYYLAVVHRLDDDGMLRIVAGSGPLARRSSNFLAWEQSIHQGVNGRVARTAESSLIHDTTCDPDYLGRDPRHDPGSELSVPIIVADRTWGVLNLEQLATHAFNEDDVLLAESVVAQMGAAFHRCDLIDQLQGTFATTLGILSDALDARDSYTARHTTQVMDLSLAVAARLALPAAKIRALGSCARLHDIGKLGVRTELLSKPGPLTAAEYAEMQEHSAIGEALLARIPLLAEVAPLVRAVHERWDGAGYPDRLGGSAIPIESRIVAVCDAWDAMTSHRPYRPALTSTDALAELMRCAGSQFDPEVVAAFVEAQDVEPPPAFVRGPARYIVAASITKR
jgi:diguanylate cyclase (GGDEF)-like protein